VMRRTNIHINTTTSTTVWGILITFNISARNKTRISFVSTWMHIFLSRSSLDDPAKVGPMSFSQDSLDSRSIHNLKND
jgi:hypothetical protein